MDQAVGLNAACARAPGIVRTACVTFDSADPARELVRLFGADEMELVILFVTSQADASSVIAEASAHFAPTPVVGCTTAGELTGAGYTEDQIVEMIRNRNAMMDDVPDWHHEFTFLMIDGLSTKEDALTSELAVGLGPVPLFGGSAGDGTRFEHTYVLHNGNALENAAILTQVRTRCPIKVFKSDHLHLRRASRGGANRRTAPRPRHPTGG